MSEINNLTLITGGLGYIGSHVVVSILETGKGVIIVDNNSNSYIETFDNIRILTNNNNKIYFYDINLCNLEDLDNIFKQHRNIDEVIHLAGFKAIGESISNPILYYHNNLISSINLITCLKKYEIYNIIFSSSAAVYGIANEIPITENSLKLPIHPYGRSKLAIEWMLEDLYKSESDKWRIVSLRYFNVIGAHESNLIGDNPLYKLPNNLIPYIMKVATGELEKLNIFGGDYDTRDGTCVRDYIHVVDLAEYHKLAIEKTRKDTGFFVYNLGNGEGISILEILKIFNDITGIEIPYEIIDRRPGDPSILIADSTLVREELNYNPRYSIDKMILDHWNFWKKILNKF